MNKVTLIGRLTRDLDVRYTQSGKAVANGSIAVSRRKKDDGADFINIIIWDKLAENTAKYCGKGSQIGLVGRLQVSSYDNQEGKKVYKTEVVVEEVEFLGSKKDNQSSNQDFTPVDSDDDFLPFG